MTTTGIAILNASRGTPIAVNVEVATNVWDRFRGLMLRSHFPEGSGLVIDRCSSIHMFFMRFPIDVLYLDRDDRVVRIQEHVKPWRIGPLWTKNARCVVELPAGTVARTNTNVGDRIQVNRPG